MVAIDNENDFLNAISCLYTLNFKTDGKTNLGFATQRAILNLN